MHYDLLVVGAGPAGSTIAQIVAKENKLVLLVDKKSTIGEPVQCAEYVPALLSNEIVIPPNYIANRVKNLKLYTPAGNFEFISPGYIINRLLFDKWLAINAVKSGAKLWLNTKFAGLKNGKAILLREGKVLKINATIIAGADGVQSTVRRLINNQYRKYVIGYQQEFPLVTPMDWTEVYFDKKFLGGYAWLFPKKFSANVGLGINLTRGCSIRLKELLNLYVKQLVRANKIIPHPISTITGLIPVGGPVDTVKENIILVGDAAGQTHPITGAGITQAIICAKFAAQAIVNALAKKDINLLKYYENAWQNLYGAELKRAVSRRVLMETNWHKLESYLKQCWVSFPEYYG